MNGRHIKEAGFISIRALFWLAFLAALGYGAYMFLPPYVGYYMLKTEVEGEAKTAHMYTDEVLAKRITGKAATWSVSLDSESLQIYRGVEDIRIEVNYTVDLNFFDRYHHELVYSIEVEEPLKEPGKVLQ